MGEGKRVVFQKKKNVSGDGWHASKIPYAIYDQILRFSLPYSCDLPKNSTLIYDRSGRRS